MAALEAATGADCWARTKEVKSAVEMDRRLSMTKKTTERMTAVREMRSDKGIGSEMGGQLYLGGEVDSALRLR